MVSRIADPETRGSQGGALPRSCGAAFVGASHMKICETKPIEARMSFRIKNKSEKEAKIEPIRHPKTPLNPFKSV